MFFPYTSYWNTSEIKNNLKISWSGDLESLKRIVLEYLTVNEDWKSLGGEKKYFAMGIRLYHGG